jgi:hypothetical protein
LKIRIVLLLLILCISSACTGRDKPTEVSYTLKGAMWDGVVNDMLADIYESPSLEAERITQSFYNQPVEMIAEASGFLRIKTFAGIEGYILKSKVDMDTGSLETNESDQKILITGKTKTIYSKPDGRMPVEKVVMGTVLSYRGKVGDWIRVALCKGMEGYITLNDIILYESRIPLTNTGSFIRDIVSFAGVRYLKGGSSVLEGIDMPNLISVCAVINGYTLSLDISEMTKEGKSVSFEEIMPGDILFLSNDRYNDIISDLAVIISDDEAVAYSEKDMSISILKLLDLDARYRTRKIIRIFEEE